MSSVSNKDGQVPTQNQGQDGALEEHGLDHDVGSSDEESDQYRLEVHAERPRKISEKKRAAAGAFQHWVLQNQRQIKAEREDTAKSKPPVAAMGMSNDERLRVISTPREYQLELFERAKEKNTIVVLDTGSGKTLIAALLLRHILYQETEARAKGAPPKTAFFVVEKVALCLQQADVLRANIEFPITHFFGDRTGITRNKEYWDRVFSEHMAIVCTAQILLDLLGDGFIKMTQINLLVFDEAHHAKKNHPFARIVKNHYMRVPDRSQRPRILGMTASPVDAKARDVRAIAMELEGLLCSEIATVSYNALLQSQDRRSQHETVEYYTSLMPVELCLTDLSTMIKQALGQYDLKFRANFDYAAHAGSSLGPWCADRHWKLAMTDQEISRLLAHTIQSWGASHADAAETAVRAACRVVQNYHPTPLAKTTMSIQLSSKTILLGQILEDAFTNYDTKRCIVFVEKRFTAFLLADLFDQPAMRISGMNTAYLIGSRSDGSSVVSMSFNDQFATLDRFRQGEINCLFSTTVAEEGIDIPECDLIIRFDLYQSVIQYIQSKGRARQRNSKYVQMVQRDNMTDARRLKQAARDAQVLRIFCSALPEDRKLQDESIDVAAALEFELKGQKTYEIASTGARLTMLHSLELLVKFVSSISPRGITWVPEYIVQIDGKRFVADVLLPESSPIKNFTGSPQRSKQLARCSAAFGVCVALIKKDCIDENLQPKFKKILPAMRNARLAVSDKKRAEYPMRLRPELWSRLGPAPTSLFATLISLANPLAPARPTAPLLLLTRESLPQIPDIPLFFNKGANHTTTARLTSSAVRIAITSGELDLLVNFTLKIFTDVFSKDFDTSAEELPYFIAPALDNSQDELLRLDWRLLQFVKDNDYLNPENAPQDFFFDKFVVDPNSGSRKFILRGINRDLKPSDPTPQGVPKHPSREYHMGPQNIKEYSNTLFRQARVRLQSVWIDDQPVVNANLVPLRRNLLEEPLAKEIGGAMKCFLILQPLKVSSLPVAHVVMAMALPAILHRADSCMIALDACKMLDLAIEPDLALEALTKDSDNTGQHDKEQIDFQPGMGKNYERLEFLGDSFLKMATTISLFTINPTNDEYGYHVERMILICNQNLFNHAVGRGLQEYVRSKAFDRRTWYPNLKLRKGKAAKSEVRHCLGDKSIADVCEALIGAAYWGGMAAGSMDLAVKAVTKMVKSKQHNMTRFDDYYEAFKVPSWHMDECSQAYKNAVEVVAKSTGYRFRSATLLRSAFKHPSYPYESSIPNYQRLEFLGDALLDMVVVDYLFKRFPEADPQWLTEHKMAMVSNQFLACLCVTIGLNKHLLTSTAALPSQVAGYVKELELAEVRAAMEQTNNSGPRSDYWTKVADPPKALADILEAFIGAIFVDARYDYEVVRSFFTRFVEPIVKNMEAYDNYASHHPVTRLAARLSEGFGCSNWRICTEVIPSSVEEGMAALTESDVACGLMVHGQPEPLAMGTAKSGRYAKVALATRALSQLKDMDVATFEKTWKCDCKRGAGEKVAA